MPLLQINTAVDNIDQLASNASKLTAGILGKPETYVMVRITANATLTFAGTNEPCAHIKLKSLGLNEGENPAYSEKLCHFDSVAIIRSAMIILSPLRKWNPHDKF